jgi:hypothetical protein
MSAPALELMLKVISQNPFLRKPGPFGPVGIIPSNVRVISPRKNRGA